MRTPNTELAVSKLQKWLPLLDSLPHHECDGMTRCVSALLSRDGVAHTIHAGHVEAPVIGKRIGKHFWIDLGEGVLFDIKAKMWLGEDERIPHGCFRPSDDFCYTSIMTLEPEEFRYPSSLFHALAGKPMSEFTAD